jgi:hypothetical protein
MGALLGRPRRHTLVRATLGRESGSVQHKVTEIKRCVIILVAFVVTSPGAREAGLEHLAGCARRSWKIEHQIHYVRDPASMATTRRSGWARGPIALR